MEERRVDISVEDEVTVFLKEEHDVPL